jgi:hypothetical protein
MAARKTAVGRRTTDGRDATVLAVVEGALEQDCAARAGWLAQHCPDKLIDAARRILRMAEDTNADEDVSLALLTRQRT